MLGGSWEHDGDYSLVPMCFQTKGIPSMRSGTIVGQESPFERQCGRLRILLWSQLCQEVVGRRKDHVLRFGDKEIEGWRGIHHEFSMWGEGEVGTQGEIVPEQFQRGRGVWALVS